MSRRALPAALSLLQSRASSSLSSVTGHPYAPSPLPSAAHRRQLRTEELQPGWPSTASFQCSEQQRISEEHRVEVMVESRELLPPEMINDIKRGDGRGYSWPARHISVLGSPGRAPSPPLFTHAVLGPLPAAPVCFPATLSPGSLKIWSEHQSPASP